MEIILHKGGGCVELHAQNTPGRLDHNKGTGSTHLYYLVNTDFILNSYVRRENIIKWQIVGGKFYRTREYVELKSSKILQQRIKSFRF